MVDAFILAAVFMAIALILSVLAYLVFGWLTEVPKSRLDPLPHKGMAPALNRPLPPKPTSEIPNSPPPH